MLQLVIQAMNKEDVRHFTMYTSRINSLVPRKDLTLFNLLRKGILGNDDCNEDKIFAKIYPGDSNKNSFYRLKHHLLEELSKSNFNLHMQEDEQMYCYFLLAMYRYYFRRNDYKLAHYYLKRAEKLSREINYLELLDIIYGEFGRLSLELFSINPENYLTERKAVHEKLIKIREIDATLAVLSYRLKKAQNFSSSNESVLSILERTTQDFLTLEHVRSDATLKIKIYEAVSQILLQKRDYKSLEGYIAKTFDLFTKEGVFGKHSHHTKLQMLVYLANSYFKNGKYKLSLKVADRIHAALAEHAGFLKDKFEFYYYNVLVINYSTLAPTKAIELLENLKTKKSFRKEAYQTLFVFLNLAILYHDQHNFRKALQCINQLLLLDVYTEIDLTLKLKIAVFELMIRTSLNDYEVLSMRINQIRQQYKTNLKKPELNRERMLIDIITFMSKDNMTSAKKITQAFLKEHKETQDETELLNYHDWLKSNIS